MTSVSQNLYAQLLLSKPPEALTLPAVRTAGGLLMYADLNHLVDAVARALGAAGVAEGDRVVLILPNSAEFIVAFLAVTALGGVVVPVDTGAGSERLRYIIEDTAAKLCVHSPGMELRAEVAGATEANIAFEIDVNAKRSRLFPLPPQSDSSPVSWHEFGGETPAAIVYTAGSTGRPKGVVLKHKHFLAIARTLSEIVGMNPSHRDLILSPMTHSGGWQRVSSTLLAGGCVVIPQGTLTVPGILAEIQTHGITGFFATPPLLRTILMSDPEKVRRATASLLSIETASAPLAPLEIEQLMRLLPGTRILVQYGLTECSRAVILDSRAHPDKLHTVGRPTNGVCVAISSENGRALDPGQEGEILLSAAQSTDGYWNQSGLDRERFRGRWLLTGDFGRLDADGFLTYVGRRDDMINCGGHSYFPAEVERELGPHEAIKEYLVAGVPDPQKILNHVPWAFVVPRTSESWSSGEFLAWARQRLPAHKVPRRVVVIPALPLTTTGKPSRLLTVQQYGPCPEKKDG